MLPRRKHRTRHQRIVVNLPIAFHRVVGVEVDRIARSVSCSMNVPLDATAALPEEQKQALLQSIEKTQLRDRSHPHAALSRPTPHRSLQHATVQQPRRALLQSLHRVVPQQDDGQRRREGHTRPFPAQRAKE